MQVVTSTSVAPSTDGRLQTSRAAPPSEASSAGFSQVDASDAVDPKTWKAASDFEAMAIGQMLEPMFDTVDTSKGLFGGGAGEEAFKPLLITETAKEMENSGGLGLARTIYRQMLEMQEKKHD